MKKILFMLLVISSACNKDSLDHIGIVSAKQNGIEWSANIQAVPNAPTNIGMLIYLSHVNEFGIKQSSVLFIRSPLR